MSSVSPETVPSIYAVFSMGAQEIMALENGKNMDEQDIQKQVTSGVNVLFLKEKGVFTTPSEQTLFVYDHNNAQEIEMAEKIEKNSLAYGCVSYSIASNNFYSPII